MNLLDIFVRVTLIISLAIAGTSVAYYYGFYLPERDRTLDAERRTEAARLRAAQAEEKRRAEIVKAEKDRAEARYRYMEEQDKIAIRARYDRCVEGAFSDYQANWQGNCIRINGEKRKSFEYCRKTTPQLNCASMYDFEPDSSAQSCALPTQLAKSLNETRERSKDQCLKEFQLGFK